MPLLEDVDANTATGGGQFDFSATGTFVYVAGKNATQVWQVGWLDSSGGIQPLSQAGYVYATAPLAQWTKPEFSSGRVRIFTFMTSTGTPSAG